MFALFDTVGCFINIFSVSGVLIKKLAILAKRSLFGTISVSKIVTDILHVTVGLP